MSDVLNHPAAKANLNSVTLAMKGDKEGWLALYADDAVVQDPVGVSPFDATGEGHKGKAAITKFWDMVIGPSRLTINVHKRIPSGAKACAVHQTITNDLGKGRKTAWIRIDSADHLDTADAGEMVELVLRHHTRAKYE